MTILSQAEQIRDEVIPRANTADRVGDCLVDIANALNHNSAFFTMSGSIGTVIANDSLLPVVATVDADKIFTGSGIAVTVNVSPSYGYFSGLSASHAYRIDVSLSYECATADNGVNFSIGTFADPESPLLNITATGLLEDKVSLITFGGVVTNCTTAVLAMAPTNQAGAVVHVSEIKMSIVDLGLVV